MTSSERFLSLREVSDRLNIPVSTLYRWKHSRIELGAVMVRLGNHVRVRESDLEAYIAARFEEAAARVGRTAVG